MWNDILSAWSSSRCHLRKVAYLRCSFLVLSASPRLYWKRSVPVGSSLRDYERSVMPTDHLQLWSVIVIKCTEFDRWPHVISTSAMVSVSQNTWRALLRSMYTRLQTTSNYVAVVHSAQMQYVLWGRLAALSSATTAPEKLQLVSDILHFTTQWKKTELALSIIKGLLHTHDTCTNTNTFEYHTLSIYYSMHMLKIILGL